MKLAIFNSVKSNLEHIANKKHSIDNSLVHAVLLDFLKECNEADRAEIIALYSPHVASLARLVQNFNDFVVLVQIFPSVSLETSTRNILDFPI